MKTSKAYIFKNCSSCGELFYFTHFRQGSNQCKACINSIRKARRHARISSSKDRFDKSYLFTDLQKKAMSTLYKNGFNQYEIAEVFHTEQSTVCRRIQDHRNKDTK